MKKFYLFLLSTLFVCFILISQNNSFAQENGFSAKKKSSVSQQTFSPENLVQIVENESYTSERLSGSNNRFHYKSIPFIAPGNIERENFTSLKFANNNQLIFAESKAESSISFASRSQENISAACFTYLHQLSKAIHIENPEEEFQVIDTQEDDLGFIHVKMQQYFEGLLVYGGQVVFHGTNGMLKSFNGNCFPTPDLKKLEPEISTSEAIEIVNADVSQLSQMKKLTDNEKLILNYSEPISELVIYHNRLQLNAEKLVYHITVRPNFLARWEYFVDAISGEIINKYDNTCTDGPATAQAVDLNGVTRTIDTYLTGGKYYMIDASRPMFNSGQSQMPDNPVGAIWTIDANNTSGQDISLFHITSTNNQWNNPTGVSAHYNAGVTYEYYKNIHNRNSINAQGGTIISIINVADENGGGMDNAYWNGEAMFYGNGDQAFKPLAGGLDVGAHEMTHGVVQNTANLEYQYESGAINEAMADIAGCMVDRNDWQLGEDVIPAGSPYFPTGFLRDMANPHNGGSSFSDNGYQPANTSEMYQGSDDNGGVHMNSGIINHAYYLLAESISKDKAEKLFYRALANYMTKSSQFIDCRLAFEKSAKDLYGDGSAEYNAVVSAFFQVGIGEDTGGGDGSAPPGELPVNPGQDFIVSYDVNSADPNTLYISSTQGENFVPISETKMKGKLSITDDGAVGVFIDENNQMKSILLDSPYTENVISPDNWDNVAVSKDGMRIAAITTEIDSAIWVYDFDKQQWAKYHLYNPTFTPGVITNNVLYADQIEWDYSGEYIIYDAYNEMENSSGDNIDYWDMGLIRVWDKSANNWGDGQIFKVFSNLPEGISVGNPSLSKNSPFILAFDFLDSNTNEMDVMAANLETGDLGTIFANNTVLGFPNYSKQDDKIVFGAQNTGGDEIVAEINIKSNKIEPNGSASGLIGNAKWPIWYSTGVRDLSDVDDQIAENIFTNAYPNPFSDDLTVVINGKSNADYRIEVYNIYGQLISEKSGTSTESFTKTNFSFSQLAKGTYVVKVLVGNKVSSLKVVKS